MKAIAGGSADLGHMREQLGSFLEPSPEQKRAAAVTTAEAAVAGGWSPHELVEVLGALDLLEATS